MKDGTKEYTVRDMWNFWVRKQRKERPYLVYKYPGRTKNSELWYNVKAEINFLNKKILTVEAEIHKLEVVDKEINRFTSATKEIFEKKKEVYDIKERLKQLSKEKPESSKKMLDFYTFRDVIYTYNQKAVYDIIQGERINLSEKLGYMYVTKVNSPSKLIDWDSSNKFKEELIANGEQPKDSDHPDGSNWLLYYDNDYYFRWTWQKRKGVCKVRNHTVYEFTPTNTSGKGVRGVKSMLAEANRKNPLLHLNYISR